MMTQLFMVFAEFFFPFLMFYCVTQCCRCVFARPSVCHKSKLYQNGNM